MGFTKRRSLRSVWSLYFHPMEEIVPNLVKDFGHRVDEFILGHERLFCIVAREFAEYKA